MRSATESKAMPEYRNTRLIFVVLRTGSLPARPRVWGLGKGTLLRQ